MPTTSSPSFSQLRAFVALCDHQHFGEAATALGVSQPSLSQAITALEKRVGGELVERTTRRVLVTSLGEALLPFARDAVLSAVFIVFYHARFTVFVISLPNAVLRSFLYSPISSTAPLS